MSSKDSKKYVEIANHFSNRGLAVLRFDFRGSGESGGQGNLLSGRITDLKAATKLALDRGYRSIGLLGSSCGGAAAILVASEIPEINCLITWSTPCKLIELFESISTERTGGRFKNSNQISKPLESSQFMKDLSEHDVADAAKTVSKILVIHCKGDKVVPWNQAKIIYENARKPKQVKLFEKGDHQMLDPSIRKEAIELSLDWVTRYL
jgi:alpha-beta hydrolase superfamily lysophospholipase